MIQHTPGPWVIDWNVSRLDVFSSDAATLVATLRRSTLSFGIDATAIANARLIAAAPLMLHELYNAAAEIEALGGDATTQRAAIAKATGEPHA